MRDYSRIIEVLRQAGRPLCAYEFADIGAPCSSSLAYRNAREFVGMTEATLARRLRGAAAAGLVVPSKRQANNGAMLTQYSLPGEP